MRLAVSFFGLNRLVDQNFVWERAMNSNPYVEARREWDERYADLVLGKRNWQIAAGGSLVLSLLQPKRRGDADMIRWPQPSAVGFAMGTVPEEPCVDNLRVASGCGPVKDVVYPLVV